MKKKLVIWLVEDEPESIELLEHMVGSVLREFGLEKSDYMMYKFMRASPAMDAVRRMPLWSCRNILFLDQKLPDQKGSDILKLVLLREDASDMPVLMCTANPIVTGTKTFTHYGASGIVAKGYHTASLRSAIKQVWEPRLQMTPSSSMRSNSAHESANTG